MARGLRPCCAAEELAGRLPTRSPKIPVVETEYREHEDAQQPKRCWRREVSPDPRWSRIDQRPVPPGRDDSHRGVGLLKLLGVLTISGRQEPPDRVEDTPRLVARRRA